MRIPRGEHCLCNQPETQPCQKNLPAAISYPPGKTHNVANTYDLKNPQLAEKGGDGFGCLGVELGAKQM